MLLKFKSQSIFFLVSSLVLLFFINHVFGFQTSQQKITSKSRVHLYEVTFDKDLKEASVNVCFDGKAPEYLAVDYKNANKNLIEFPVSNQGYLEYQGRFWKTTNLKENACIKYKSDISEYLIKNNNIGETEPSIISFQNNNLWLWLPDKISGNENVHISFNLPSVYQISAPWQLIDEKERLFKVGELSDKLGFTLMIGDFEMRKVKLENGQEVSLAMFKNLKQKDNLQAWIMFSLNSVVSYVGEIKLPHIQVILIENNQFKTGAVPWADFRRGGGIGLRFVVNSDKDIKEFYHDWTATHEFSHLLLPALRDKDLWLSEGLASYLQYLLMAQSGVINEQEAWQKLFDGFQRGKKSSKSLNSETLVSTIQRKNSRSNYAKTMRIYWTGAAYFFKADWLLRSNSKKQKGLPDLLSKFNLCCIINKSENGEQWSGEQLSKKLDELSETTIFTDLYKETTQSKSFPEFEAIFKKLGINVNDKNVVSLSADKTQLRKSILFLE